jgi:virginiamycin B lyase
MRWYNRLMQPLSLTSLFISVLLLIAAIAMRGLDYRPPVWIATGLSGIAIASAALAYIGWGNRIFRWARILLRRHRLRLKEEVGDEGVDAALGRATDQGPQMVHNVRVGCLSHLVGGAAVIAATVVLVATAAPAPLGVLNPLQNHGGLVGSGPGGGASSGGTVQLTASPGTFHQVTPISDAGLFLTPDGEIGATPDGGAWLTYIHNDSTPGGLTSVSPSGIITTVPTPGIDSVEYFAAGRDGGLCFDGDQNSGQQWPIARRSPSGATDVYPMPVSAPGAPSAATGPVALGADGTCWFIASTGSESIAAVSKLTPGGAVTLFPISGPAVLDADAIVAAPDGGAWFLASVRQNAGQGGTDIVHVHADGSMTDLAVPSGLNAMSLAMGPDGSLWYTEVGVTSRSGRIVRITAGGAVTQFVLPADAVADNAPLNAIGQSVLSVGPDGNVWVSAGYGVLRLTPQGALTVYGLAQGGDTFAVAPDGVLWILSEKASPGSTPSSRGTLFKVTV